jgi:hypothetical protein
MSSALHLTTCTWQWEEAAAKGRAVDLTPQLPLVPLGARLRFFVMAWITLIADPWCTSVVQHGYYPEMTGRNYPRSASSRPCSMDVDQRAAMRVMVDDMYTTEVIEPVVCPMTLFSTETLPFAPVLPQVYSTYFLISKSDGGYRGCLDGRWFNQWVVAQSFRMDSLRTLRDLALPGDWMVKLDLASAYLVVPIHPHARPAFRFKTLGQSWQFRTLCFGLRSAPRVFTRLLRPVFAQLRREGIRLLSFIDDVCVLASSPWEAVQHGKRVVELLLQLGFLVHLTKTDLVPKQSDGEFLGAQVDLRPEMMCFRLPGKKRRDLRRVCRRLLDNARTPVSARDMSRVLGRMVAARMMIKDAALHSRGLERDQKQALRRSGKVWDSRCWLLSPEAILNLVWWIDVLGRPTACAMSLLESEMSIDTDASPWGFGGFLGSMCTGGFWLDAERQSSQNMRELMAVDLTLRTFVSFLRGRSVLVQTDSQVVCAYLNRQGGRFPVLSRAAETILRWCSAERLSIRCIHLRGILNTRADVRSRWGETSAEWTLDQVLYERIVRSLCARPPVVDLFAARHNAKCAIYYSRTREPESAAVNSLRQPWSERLQLYAFPPVALLLEVVAKIRREGCKVLLITPEMGASWYPLLLPMSTGPPLRLPAEGLFRGLDGQLRPSPKWRTLAWSLQGGPPRRTSHLSRVPVDLVM